MDAVRISILQERSSGLGAVEADADKVGIAGAPARIVHRVVHLGDNFYAKHATLFYPSTPGVRCHLICLQSSPGYDDFFKTFTLHWAGNERIYSVVAATTFIGFPASNARMFAAVVSRIRFTASRE